MSKLFLMIFLKTFLVMVFTQTAVKESGEICYLPNGCRFLDPLYLDELNSTQVCTRCHRMDSIYHWSSFNQSNIQCRLKKPVYYFTVILSPLQIGYILDGSNQIPRLFGFVESLSQSYVSHSLYITNMAGFNVDYPLEVKYVKKIKLWVFDMDFKFYNLYGKLIRTCDDMDTKSPNRSFIVRLSDFANITDEDYMYIFDFENVNFKLPICPLVFNGTKIASLKFSFFSNTFFKRNLIKFTNTTRHTNFYCQISSLRLTDFVGIDLDSSLLDKYVFNETRVVYITGSLKSIQPDLFKHLSKMTLFIFNPLSFINLVRKQGIDWIKGINHDLHVNLSNKFDVLRHYYDIKRLTFIPEREYLLDSNFQIAYDEDFCLFKDYPFDQLVLVSNVILEFTNKNYEPSCTLKWLVHLNKLVTFYDEYTFKNGSRPCDFPKMLQLCDIKPTKAKIENTEAALNFIIGSEFVVIIFSPIISVVGIISNVIVFVVIAKKENRNELKENQYTYMAVHSASNSFICVIQIMGLLSECQLPFGIYCSSVRKGIFVQYLKIIVGGYFSFFFRLLSNFSYLTFSLSRLFLVGGNHNFITRNVAQANAKYLLIVIVFICSVMSVPKVFLYDLNRIDPMSSFPAVFTQNRFNVEWPNNFKNVFVLIINVAVDSVNYILFGCVNFVVDVILLKKLREVIREKEKKFSNQSELSKEKLKKENQESTRRVILMVVLNSLLNIFLKLPITITSYNDLRLLSTINTQFLHLEYLHWYSLGFSMRYFCSSDRFCVIFHNFGNLLFLASTSFNLVFMKKFDKKFDSAYQQTFHPSPKTIVKLDVRVFN